MKKNSIITRWTMAGSAMMAFALLAGSAKVGAVEQMKGAQYLMKITKPEQAEALKAGDTMAMVCAKCQSVVVHNVTTEKGHIKTMTVGEKHLCPGCESTITVVGTGKSAHDEVRHVCGKCGDDSAFCCATKPGASPTKGMEKK